MVNEQRKEQKMNAFEMRCYRKILRVQLIEERTNVSILEPLGNIPEYLLLDSITRQKLNFFGHTKRHDSQEKEIYEGIIEGRRGRGRCRLKMLPYEFAPLVYKQSHVLSETLYSKF